MENMRVPYDEERPSVIKAYLNKEPLECKQVMWKAEEEVGRQKINDSLEREKPLDNFWSMWRVEDKMCPNIKFVIMVKEKTIFLLVYL